MRPLPLALALATVLSATAPLSTTSCKPAVGALDLFSRKAKCVVENQHLPDKAVFDKCAVLEPDDIRNLTEILAGSRRAAATACASNEPDSATP